MNTNDLMVTELSYKAPGFHTTELLIATPHAILHYKVMRPLTDEGRVRITTDVRAMATTWWADRVKKLKDHDFSRRLHATGKRFRVDPQSIRAASMAEVIAAYDLEPLLRQDEKARNAWMTAMGHHADMAHEDDFRAAREAKAAQVKEARRTQEAEITRQRALVDAEWGMF